MTGRGAGIELFALGLSAVVGCASMQASTVALGGDSRPEQRGRSAVRNAPEAEAGARAEEAAVAEAEVAEVSAPRVADAPVGVPPELAFSLRPLAVGDVWSRLVDVDFAVVAQAPLQGQSSNVDVRVVSHQELRFEVLAVADGKVSSLGLRYVEATSKTEMMGQQRSETEPVSGNRYVVTLSLGKPSVAYAQGGKPSTEELNTVKDDAEEPDQNQLALKELAALAAAGKGDLSAPAAAALAGGDQNEIKLTLAKASLSKLSKSAQGASSAVLDVSFGLASTAKPGDAMKMEAQLNGTVTVGANPTRIQTMSVSGPITIAVPSPDGGRMDGTGKMKMEISYRY